MERDAVKRLSQISWEECQEYLQKQDRVLLPIGATEAHGRHLGLGCDSTLAGAIADRAGARTGVVVAPLLTYGMSFHFTEFPGTLSLSPGTLSAVLAELLTGLYRSGFRRVIVVNGHGGNDGPLRAAHVAVAGDLPLLRVKSFAWWTEPQIARLVDEAAGPQKGTHASTHETAFLMAADPDAVDMARVAHHDAPVEPTREQYDARTFAQHYPNGVMGLDPSAATKALGKQIWNIAVDLCVAELENW